MDLLGEEAGIASKIISILKSSVAWGLHSSLKTFILAGKRFPELVSMGKMGTKAGWNL